MEGETNVPARQFQLSVRNNGNLLNTADALQVRIDGDHTYGRSPGGEWREMDNFADAFAPGSDLLVYLAGAKNVQLQADPTGLAETVGSYTQYSFELDGPALANRLRDQLEQYLIEKGELPAQMSLQAPTLYRDATGQGSIWISQDGLPLRLSLEDSVSARGQRRAGRGRTQNRLLQLRAGAGFANPIDQLAGALGLPRTVRDWQRAGSAGAALLMACGMVYALTMRSRSKKLQTAVVLAVIFSMVVTPLLESQKVYAFAQNQQAQQAQADQQQKDQEAEREAKAQFTESTWNPHQDPLGSSGIAGIPVGGSGRRQGCRRSRHVGRSRLASGCLPPTQPQPHQPTAPTPKNQPTPTTTC